jgi:uncharacterized coiled-coil DUF342 family protein
MDGAEQKRRQAQSIEQEIANINQQEDILERKIREYEIAKQRSPQSANAYAIQIENLKRQIDILRNKRINASSRLQNTNREISLLEKRETEERLKQPQRRYFRGGGPPFEGGAGARPGSTPGPGPTQGPGMGRK